MKPIIIIPEGAMKPEHIKALCDNDLCVVEAKDPSVVKFVDPIPVQSSRTQIEQAAIALSRKVLEWGWKYEVWKDGKQVTRSAAALFVDFLVKGSPLDPNIEVERNIFDTTKADELRKLAREEAKAERKAINDAKKQAADAKKKKPTVETEVTAALEELKTSRHTCAACKKTWDEPLDPKTCPHCKSPFWKK